MLDDVAGRQYLPGPTRKLLMKVLARGNLRPSVERRKLNLTAMFESASSNSSISAEIDAVNPGSTWGQPEVSLGSIWG